MGYCGKDHWRRPLTGLELRACWEEGRRTGAPFGSIAPSSGAQPPVAGPALHIVQESQPRGAAVAVRGDRGPLDRPDPMRLRGFVPVDELMAAPLTPTPVPLAPAAAAPESEAPLRAGSASTGSVPPVAPPEPWEVRTSLFGEVER